MKKLVFILGLFCTHAVQSATITVANNANTGAGSLRAAIAAAASGDVIVFASSLANQTITLAATLEIPVAKSLTIDGGAAANLTISGNNAVRVFLLKSTSVQPTTLNLKNIRIINARTNEYGGGIKSEHQGMMNFENCTFNNNRADEGGSAIFSAFEGKTTIKNCQFNNNVSIANNTERGSTVMLWGPFAQTIQNSDFTNNKGINGAAINGLNAALLIEDCDFLNNTTTDAFFDAGEPNPFLRGFGGAIYADRATPDMPTSLLGSIIIRRSKFDGNRGEGEGGACYLYTDETDDVLIENCHFNDNTSMALTGGGSEGSGGAIQQMNNEKNRGFVVRNTTFSNNRAGVLGGAIRADWADTQITNCTFFNNRGELTNGTGYSANGGALAFFSMSGSIINITNSTFANNYAGWVGGAIASSDPSKTRIKNNVFFQNTAGNGGNNWKIQQHTSAELNDLGNNMQFPNKFTNNGNDYNVSASVTIANPLLGSLANNGGPTPTMALQTGSPAINAGAGCPTFDQRGAARVGVCDIGAFEFGSTLTKEFIIRPSIDGVVTQNNTQDLARKYVLLEPTTDIRAVTLTSYLAQIVPAAPLAMNTNDSPKVDFDGNKPLAEQDTISFSYFESLMASNRKIPTYLAEKYVKNSTIQFDDATNFVGQKQRIYLKEHKVLYVKFGDSNSSKGIIICYDNNNRQISWETFLLSCNNCGPNFSRKEVVFLSDNTIEVVSFKLQDSKEMPNLADIDAAKTEKYFIESNGKISKKQ